jgi:hypothetical protein
MQVARLSKTPVLRRMRQPSIAPLPFGPALQRRQPLGPRLENGAARMTTDGGQIRRTGSSNNPSRSSRVLLNSHSRPAGQQSRRATARPPILCLFSERSVMCVASFLHRRFAYPCQNDLIEAPNRNLALTVQKYRDTFRAQIKNNDQRSGIRIVIIGLWRKLIFGQN